jgi:RNA polymerase sigma-70 factor, ECF subfamily
MPKANAPGMCVAERIAAARKGDERALEDVIRHYQNRVAGYVVSLVGRETADIDDLCQVVFVKMALSLPRLRALEVFEPWLFKIARNVCRDHLRRLRFRRLFVPLSSHHERIPTDQPENAESKASGLDGALNKLSGAQRELIHLLCAREYSYDELARLTKSSTRAVAGRLFRARTRLRKLLSYSGADQ